MASDKEIKREKELGRRELMKLALAGGGYVLLPGDRAFAKVPSSFADSPKSPTLTPFVAPLPVPPQIGTAPVPGDRDELEQEYEDELFGRCRDRVPDAQFISSDNTLRSRIVAETRAVRAHPNLPPTPQWGYRPEVIPDGLGGQWDFALGPTLVATYGAFQLGPNGGGVAVHYTNNLPANAAGPGVPQTTIHFHGGHHPAQADGFPTDLPDRRPFVVQPGGGEYDYYFPTLDPGDIDGLPEKTERPSTLWYHDHFLDFTGPNVYRGLAGMFLGFDLSTPYENGAPGNFDGGEELDESDGSLRLPSGYGIYDIPMVIQDKMFAANGSLVFDPFNHNGFLGDTFCVNGAVQPFMLVERRKYRFRFLNASTARIYAMYLTNSLGYKFPMQLIGLDSSLLSRTIPIDNFLFAPAERVEVVIDFGSPEFASQDELFVENRLRQKDGRKPDGQVRTGVKIMKFILTGGAVDDPSRLGIENANGGFDLRPFAPISQQELAGAVRRTFEFDRSHGAWTINGKLAGDLSRPVARPKAGQGEIWRLVNKSGGWWHPIHIHSEFFRIIKRKGRAPLATEGDGVAKKEVVLLRDNDSVEVFLRFRDHLGPFVFHCHNLGHEDMAMMGRFDVVP